VPRHVHAVFFAVELGLRAAMRGQCRFWFVALFNLGDYRDYWIVGSFSSVLLFFRNLFTILFSRGPTPLNVMKFWGIFDRFPFIHDVHFFSVRFAQFPSFSTLDRFQVLALTTKRSEEIMLPIA